MFNDFNILIEGKKKKKKKGTRIIKQIHMSFLSKLGGKNVLVGLERKQWTPPIFSSKITPTKYSKKKKNHFLPLFHTP